MSLLLQQITLIALVVTCMAFCHFRYAEGETIWKSWYRMMGLAYGVLVVLSFISLNLRLVQLSAN